MIKHDDDYQLKGESVVTLVNGEKFYVRDARIRASGVAGVDSAANNLVEIPHEYVRVTTDADHWQGARHRSRVSQETLKKR